MHFLNNYVMMARRQGPNMSQCIKQNKSYFLKFRYLEHIINLIIFTYTVDPRATTDLTYEQLGLRPKF